MKLALVHDWLEEFGGAERVLIALHEIFPEAPIYTISYNRRFTKKYLPDATIRPSFLNNWFLPRKWLAPFMPLAVESFDLSDFDTVISSSVFFSKGLVLRPRTKHICYCYSPARPLWDRTHVYENKSWPSKIVRHFLRIWDRQTADRVDQFIAISKTVQQRIRKYYGRDSQVIYPPMAELTQVDYQGTNDFYLIVSRLYPHKNIEIAIDAFSKLGHKLLIVGDGPLRSKLEKLATSNIKFLGHIPDHLLTQYYQNCKALIMPQEEDFGLTPIEAMSYGKPVLALGRGGALETLQEGISGLFFADPIPESLAEGVRRLNDFYDNFDPVKIKVQAAQFSKERFKKEILNLL